MSNVSTGFATFALEVSGAEREMTREAEQGLRRLLDSSMDLESAIEIHVQGQSEHVVLPRSVVRLLGAILEANAKGDSVTILPSAAELTPNQAADILGVSRPYLIKLLDEGQIPFRYVGSHRRIRVEELSRYRKREEERQLKVLAELQDEAQRLGMGY